jgi:cystathionine beta-lyase
MMIISNPHNPVGRCWTPQELTKMADLCLKYKTLLVSDEIHADLMMRGSQHTVTANLSPEIAANTITCMSPSKTFNLAGLSTSEIIIPDLTLRKQFVQLMNKKWHIASGNIFGDVALEAAYTLGEEWLEQLLDYLTNNVDYCKEFFKRGFRKRRPIAMSNLFALGGF